MRTLAQLLAGLTGFALCLAWAGVPARARAQHGTAGYGAMPMDPRSSVLLEVQTAEFELPGRSGVWQTLAPRLEYAVVPWLSLSARPGVARVEYDDGESALGPADTELTVKARVFRHARRRMSVSLGLSGELPTGDAGSGTGNGHGSVFPFATFMAMPSQVFMLHAMAGDRLVLSPSEHAAHAHAGSDARPHGSVIMPHAEHELSAHAGACITLQKLVISPGLELMQVFSPGDDTLLTAQLEVALVPRRELRVAAGFDLPLLAAARFEWRSRLMAALLF